MTILLAGCGGGYDIYCGIPQYFKYMKEKKNVLLLNLSFTSSKLLEDLVKKKQIYKPNPNYYIINFKNITDNINNNYFPEYYLSKELKCDIYIIDSESTINQIKDAYNHIIKYKNIYKIHLIDGGCDSLLSGKESHLATPTEDMIHMRAIMDINVDSKIISCVGMTCDCNQLPKEEFIERLNELNDILINTNVWNLKDTNIQKYYNIFYKCQPRRSIVNSLICARLDGYSGYYVPSHLKDRIVKNNVYLDDYMITYNTYDFNELVKRILYIEELDMNANNDNINNFILSFQKKMKT